MIIAGKKLNMYIEEQNQGCFDKKSMISPNLWIEKEIQI